MPFQNVLTMLNTVLVCINGVKHWFSMHFLSRNVKIRQFLSRKTGFRAVSRKKWQMSAASRLHIFSRSGISSRAVCSEQSVILIWVSLFFSFLKGGRVDTICWTACLFTEMKMISVLYWTFIITVMNSTLLFHFHIWNHNLLFNVSRVSESTVPV